MNTDKENKDTLEGKAKRKNGVKRMIFAIIAIALEITLIFFLLTELHSIATWIEIILHLLALVLVLRIYGKEITSSMKMPWVILILTFPVFGTVMYILVGTNGGTHRMTKRFEEVDSQLLPLLAGRDDETIKRLKETDPSAGGISTYIRTSAGYPVYQNTDVTYYDDAAKGLEAQLRELKKAERFIFMEYHAIEDKTSWKRIEDILAQKASQGVEVRVFYDDM